jgi:hypothetical protein
METHNTMNLKFLSYLILATLLINACEKDEENDLNLLSIDLITEDNPAFFAKTVILFENSEYLIKTNFNTYINSYPFGVLQGYSEIEQQAIQDSKNNDELIMTDYLSRAKDSTYVLANHLENGTCLVFDKNRNKIISSIKMEEYFEGVPMASIAGRKFYINGDLFLETVDMIS